jgi:hypothetical protein
MPDPFVRHHAQAVFHRLARAHDGEIARHDLVHLRFARAFAAQHHFPRVIALRDQADQFSILNDQKRADVFVRHELDRLEDRGLWRNRENLGPFLGENRVDCSRYVHDPERSVAGRKSNVATAIGGGNTFCLGR